MVRLPHAHFPSMSDEYCVETMRQTLPTSPVAPVAVAPRGPRGLWDALVAVSGGAPAPVEVGGGEAHLAYLARLSGTTADCGHGGNGHGGAYVIDLAGFRTRRHCRAS